MNTPAPDRGHLVRQTQSMHHARRRRCLCGGGTHPGYPSTLQARLLRTDQALESTLDSIPPDVAARPRCAAELARRKPHPAWRVGDFDATAGRTAATLPSTARPNGLASIEVSQSWRTLPPACGVHVMRCNA
jgi:hypothetical protein